MKKTLIFIAIICIIAACVGMYAPHVLKRHMVSAIERAIPGAKADLKLGHLGLRAMSVSSLSIVKGESFTLKAGEVEAFYSPMGLLRRDIELLRVSGMETAVNMPFTAAADIPGSLMPGKTSGAVIGVRLLEIARAGISINSKDLKMEGSLSAELADTGKAVRSLSAEASTLRYGDVNMKEISLVFYPGMGRLKVGETAIKKTIVKDLVGTVELAGEGLRIKNIHGALWEGTATGEGTISARKGIDYRFNIDIAAISIENVISDLDLDKKMRFFGRLGGSLELSGRNTALSVLKGAFRVAPPGGGLDIKDRSILEDIATRAKQNVDMIVETFQKYHYNDGSVSIALQDKDLTVRVALQGESGKRDLTLVVHEFITPGSKG